MYACFKVCQGAAGRSHSYTAPPTYGKFCKNIQILCNGINVTQNIIRYSLLLQVRIASSYRCGLLLQVWPPLTGMASSYRYSLLLQVWPPLTGIASSYRYSLLLQVWPPLTGMASSYRYSLLLQVWPPLTGMASYILLR